MPLVIQDKKKKNQWLYLKRIKQQKSFPLCNKIIFHFRAGRQKITTAIIWHSMQKSPNAHKSAEIWDVATRETAVHCRRKESCPTVSGLPQQLSAVVCISLQRELEFTWGPQGSCWVQSWLSLWCCFNRWLCPQGHLICYGTSKWAHICAVVLPGMGCLTQPRVAEIPAQVWRELSFPI